MAKFRCLKLDSSWTPIEIIDWFEAFCQVYVEPYPCNILWEYPEKYKIRSQNSSWSYPSIIVLKNFTRPKKEKNVIKPSLKSILVRDLYRCGYCGVKLSGSSGTRDHIIPESKGGPSSWSNLIACCKPCQNKKKDHMPEDVGMFPTKTPKAPHIEEKFAKYIKLSSAFEKKCWMDGLKNLGMHHLILEESIENLK